MKTVVKIVVLIAVVGLIGCAGNPENSQWQYDTRQIQGWTVKVDKRLLGSKFYTELTERNLIIVDEQLANIVEVIPAKIIKKLRKVKIYVTPKVPGTPFNDFYRGSLSNPVRSKQDPRMVGIQLSGLTRHNSMLRRFPMVVLHEFTHAYQYKVLGWDNWRIRSAYQRAMKTGLYRNSYAATNIGEFFADTSIAYFGNATHYPYNRARLEKDDPKTAALIRRLWKVN